MDSRKLSRQQKALIRSLEEIGNGKKIEELAEAIDAPPEAVERWLDDPGFLQIVYEESLKQVITCIPRILHYLTGEVFSSFKTAEDDSSVHHPAQKKGYHRAIPHKPLDLPAIKFLLKLAETVKENIRDVDMPTRDEIINIICEEQERLSGQGDSAGPIQEEGDPGK